MILQNNMGCGICMAGYYKDKVTAAVVICSVCDESCQSCVDEESCAVCKEGYYRFRNETGLCSENSSLMNCSRVRPTTRDGCAECNEGYFVDTTDKCSLCGEGCMRCQQYDSCLYCMEGYFKRSNTCVACSTVENCVKCHDVCLECDVGFVLDNNKMFCDQPSSTIVVALSSVLGSLFFLVVLVIVLVALIFVVIIRRRNKERRDKSVIFNINRSNVDFKPVSPKSRMCE